MIGYSVFGVYPLPNNSFLEYTVNLVADSGGASAPPLGGQPRVSISKYLVSTHSPHTRMNMIITCAFSNVLIMNLSILEFTLNYLF